MPAAADKKRKKPDAGKASPAKKRKVDTSPKKKSKPAEKKKPKPVEKKKAPVKAKPKPTPKKKAAPASKAKKVSEKSGKAKTNDKKPVKVVSTKKNLDQVKKAVKSKPEKKADSIKARPVKKEIKKPTVVKNNQKVAKTTKPVPKKPEKPKPNKLAEKTITRTKVDTTKAKAAQAKLAQAKLKAAKSLAKSKAVKPEAKKARLDTKQSKEENKQTGNKQQNKKSDIDEETKKEVKKSVKVETSKQPQKKETAKPTDDKSSDDGKKRKIEEPEVDTPRKRRIITPNKRYADFETDTSPKRISELRAFLQDKKKTPTIKEEDSSVKKENTPVRKVVKAIRVDYDKPKQSPEIKVIKASEMKPAEKLLKKLQKKLEKEAKASFVKPKQSIDKDSSKTKITKVVTYNKSVTSKTSPKNIVSKDKVKPAVVVKKKSTSNAEKVIKIVPKAAPTPKKIKEQKKDERKIQTKFLFQKNVKQKDDANLTCWITGIDVYKSGEIVMVDMANKKIKLFTSTFEFMSQAKLDTTPQDISISPVDAGVAYFTKPFSKEGIQKVCLSDGILTLKDSILTNGTNRGIKCIKSGILTSVQNGRYHDLDINCFKIELLDYKGNVLQSVSADDSGNRLFKLPLYFTTNTTDKQIIVSDCIRNNSYILSLDMTGKVKFKFTGIRDNLITPRGLTTDDENNIYVTEWDKHNVYVLTPTGKRQQLLLDHAELLKEGQDGLKKPYQLCFYKHEDGGRLIVSQESCNMIKVFQLGQKLQEQNGEAQVSSEVKDSVKTDNSPTTAVTTPTSAVTTTISAVTTPTSAVIKPSPAVTTPTSVVTTSTLKVSTPAPAVVAATVQKTVTLSPAKPPIVVSAVKPPIVVSPVKPPAVVPPSKTVTVVSTIKPITEAAKIIKITPVPKVPTPAPVIPIPEPQQEVQATEPQQKEATASTSLVISEESVPPSANILTQEHAYTTIAPQVQVTPAVVECASEEAPPSDPIDEDGPEELSSLVDSIISDLKSREPQSVLSAGEEIVTDHTITSDSIL